MSDFKPNHEAEMVLWFLGFAEPRFRDSIKLIPIIHAGSIVAPLLLGIAADSVGLVNEPTDEIRSA